MVNGAGLNVPRHKGSLEAVAGPIDRRHPLPAGRGGPRERVGRGLEVRTPYHLHHFTPIPHYIPAPSLGGSIIAVSRGRTDSIGAAKSEGWLGSSKRVAKSSALKARAMRAANVSRS